jgi:hypothetical protein
MPDNVSPPPHVNSRNHVSVSTNGGVSRRFDVIGFHSMAPIDLSQVEKLKEVEFHPPVCCDRWFIDLLKKIPKDFEQISIRLPARLDSTSWLSAKKYMSLDNFLVQLSESGKIRTKAICHGGEERAGDKFIRDVFPKMTKSGRIKLVTIST